MNAKNSPRLSSCGLLLSLLLTGCATSEGLTTHNSVLSPDSLQAQKSLAGVHFSPAAWPQQAWWKNFNDPQLNQLIDQALATSPDLQIVNAQAAKANAAVVAAEASRMPTLDADGSVTRSRIAKVDDPLLEGHRYSTLRSAYLSASYTLDLWGGKKAAWESALGAARASEVDKQGARLTLAANVTRAYINLNLNKELEKLAAENVKRTESISQLQQKYFANGLSTRYQYNQARATAKSAEQALTAAKQATVDAGIKLSILLGKGPDAWRSLKQVQLSVPQNMTLPSDIPAELVGRRPDVVAARWRVESAEKNIAAVKTEFYPNINLVAEAGSRNLLGDAFFGAPSQFFNIGPTLSLPIFDGGKRRADLATSNADWDLAVAHYNSTVISALGNISDSIVSMKSLGEQNDQAQQANQLVHSAWDDVSKEYSAGLRPFLDVLSLQSQLIESDQQVAELKAQQLSQAVLLIEQLGGGFKA